MSELVTRFLDLPVYTARGMYVGQIGNVILDVETQKAASLLVTGTNPKLVDGAQNVAVPYRWVQAIGDIVILSHFPDHVEVTVPEEETVEEKLEREIAA